MPSQSTEPIDEMDFETVRVEAANERARMAAEAQAAGRQLGREERSEREEALNARALELVSADGRLHFPADR